MGYALENNVLTDLAADVAAGATSIDVNYATAPARSPPDPGSLTGIVTLADPIASPTKIEVVAYTGRTDNGDGTYTLTGVTKGQEGFADQSWNAGDDVFQGFTAAVVDEVLHPSVNTVASSGTSLTLDRSTAPIWDVTLDADLTLSLSGYASGVLDSIILYARQDSTGSRTITWPSELVWPDAVEPDPNTDPSTLSVWQLDTVDGGTAVLSYLLATGVA